MATILEGGKKYRAEGLIHGIRANSASDAKEALSWHIRNMGWKDHEVEITIPPGSTPTPVNGVRLVNDSELLPTDHPFPIVITGIWNKPAASLPVSAHLSPGTSRITLTSASELGGVQPTPPEPAPPHPAPSPPKPQQNPGIVPIPKQSEANASTLMPLVVAGGIVALMVWSWKSRPKRRNL